ncbi:MAG TPA: TetR family transcriptional regulator [Crenalkalicoccus sp.]|nr:TetR family transcriptional regulator [Crenalkalicoccus sp.]
MSASADPDARLVAGLWRVVAAHGWYGLTLRRVAGAAGLPMEWVRQRSPTPLDLLRLHVEVIDRAVLRGTVAGQGESPRDRIFDVLMRRLDAMQPHRPGLVRFLDELRGDPPIALFVLGLLPRSMAWMLEAAELDTTGLAGVARIQGLVAVWLATLRAWLADDSPDLGATMAALDRALDRAEQVARSIGLPAGG